MLDFSVMLQVNLLLVERIHLQSNVFATDVENKAVGNSELTVVTALVGNFQSCKSMHFILSSFPWLVNVTYMKEVNTKKSFDLRGK